MIAGVANDGPRMAAPEVRVGRSTLAGAARGLVTDNTLVIGGKEVGVFVGESIALMGGMGLAEGPEG